jgi:hypothetical protein
MERFPSNFGTDLAGLSFNEIFDQQPKWVEYVSELWTDNCTGLFLDFRNYIILRLKDPISRSEHEQRCHEYVKTMKIRQLPEYLVKYATRSTLPLV